jgi:uncharacterized protein YcnI
MRCSAWSSLAISVCSALALILVAPAGAHVDATPAFLAAETTETISLAVHNDREIPMSSFQVAAPAGLRIEEAGESSGWTSSTDGRIATWSGGSVPWNEAVSFELTLGASAEPGAVALETRQGYSDGDVFHWPVPITVVPGEDTSSAGYVWGLVIAGALVVGLAGLAVVWRRRALRR